MVGICHCENDIESVLYETSVKSNAHKGVALPYNGKIVLIPLLHES